MSYYITLFEKQIPLYGLCFYGGILFAAAIALLIAKKRDLPRWEIVYSAIYIMIGAMLGSKLLFLIVSMEQIVQMKLSLLSVIKGGFVFYGGLLGGTAGLLIYTKIYKMKISPFLDVYAVVLPLGHAIGRVGCFFGGCCYGIGYDGLFSVTYCETVGQTPLNTPLLPIQLIEAVALLLLFLLQLCLYGKKRWKGKLVYSYLSSYAAIRFVLEFFRGDAERGSLLCLSTSQWISLLMFLAMTVFHGLRRFRHRKQK